MREFGTEQSQYRSIIVLQGQRHHPEQEATPTRSHNHKIMEASSLAKSTQNLNTFYASDIDFVSVLGTSARSRVRNKLSTAPFPARAVGQVSSSPNKTSEENHSNILPHPPPLDLMICNTSPCYTASNFRQCRGTADKEKQTASYTSSVPQELDTIFRHGSRPTRTGHIWSGGWRYYGWFRSVRQSDMSIGGYAYTFHPRLPYVTPPTRVISMTPHNSHICDPSPQL